MSTDRDDLDSEWATIKSLPSTKALAEDVDLRRDLMAMAPHPEVVYTLSDGGSGLRYMSIWRMKCFGQKRRGPPMYPRKVECWVVG